MPLFTSQDIKWWTRATVYLEVERVSSFTWESTSARTSPGHSTPPSWSRKHLRRLRMFGMSPKILSNFYSCVVESVLSSCITVWYGSTTVRDRKRLQRVVETAEKIIRTSLPSLQFTGELPPSLRTPPTHNMDCSHSYPHSGGTGPRNAGLLPLSH